MDAFDAGIIGSNNTQTVRKIIELRINSGKKLENRWDSSGRQTYSLNQLKADISRVTKEKEAFVNEANFKQTRLLIFLEGLKTINGDKEVVEILKSEGLENLPEMKGEYNV
jgi:microsomal dipeptidase-like Zn-dependent dipeptidase